VDEAAGVASADQDVAVRGFRWMVMDVVLDKEVQPSVMPTGELMAVADSCTAALCELVWAIEAKARKNIHDTSADLTIRRRDALPWESPASGKMPGPGCSAALDRFLVMLQEYSDRTRKMFAKTLV
jgi:hypothetical protein